MIVARQIDVGPVSTIVYAYGPTDEELEELYKSSDEHIEQDGALTWSLSMQVNPTARRPALTYLGEHSTQTGAVAAMDAIVDAMIGAAHSPWDITQAKEATHAP